MVRMGSTDLGGRLAACYRVGMDGWMSCRSESSEPCSGDDTMARTMGKTGRWTPWIFVALLGCAGNPVEAGGDASGTGLTTSASDAGDDGVASADDDSRTTSGGTRGSDPDESGDDGTTSGSETTTTGDPDATTGPETSGSPTSSGGEESSTGNPTTGDDPTGDEPTTGDDPTTGPGTTSDDGPDDGPDDDGPDSGDDCPDASPANDTAQGAVAMGDQICNDGPDSTQGALAGAADSDWWRWDGIWTCGADANAVAEARVQADGQLEVCVFADCINGQTSTTCDGDPLSLPGGFEGCCATDEVRLGVDCSPPNDESARLLVRVEPVDPAACISYELEYDFREG